MWRNAETGRKAVVSRDTDNVGDGDILKVPPQGPDLVQLLLVAKERVVAAVLALEVFGLQVAPPGAGAAARLQGLTGGHTGSPEAVPGTIAQL